MRNGDNMNDERMISEIVQYYNDYDGTLEESMFNWLIGRIKELKDNNANVITLLEKCLPTDEFTYYEIKDVIKVIEES